MLSSVNNPVTFGNNTEYLRIYVNSGKYGYFVQINTKSTNIKEIPVIIGNYRDYTAIWLILGIISLISGILEGYSAYIGDITVYYGNIEYIRAFN